MKTNVNIYFSHYQSFDKIKDVSHQVGFKYNGNIDKRIKCLIVDLYIKNLFHFKNIYFIIDNEQNYLKIVYILLYFFLRKWVFEQLIYFSEGQNQYFVS